MEVSKIGDKWVRGDEVWEVKGGWSIGVEILKSLYYVGLGVDEEFSFVYIKFE